MKGVLPVLSWLAILPMAFVSWPVALFGPIKVQEWRFRRFAESLPAYQFADRRIQSLVVLGGDSAPQVRVAFETRHVTIPQMIQFYRNYFVRDGWTELDPQEQYKPGVWYWFRKGHYSVCIIGYEGGKWGGMQCVAVVRSYNTYFYAHSGEKR